jgi:hypothetical protein
MKYDELKHRQFKTSLFTPFQGNVIFELYDCNGSDCLRFLLNEQPILLPGCRVNIHGLCPVSEFFQLMDSNIGCDFEQICQVI